MRPEGDAESLVDVLVHQDSASGKRDPQMRRLNLKNDSLKGDGVIVSHGPFFFDGEDEIKIQMSLNWHKGRAHLLRFNRKAFVVLTDVDLLDEAIGSLFGFDVVQAKLIAESALKSSVDPFTPASGLGRVSRNGADAQLCESAANLSEMSLQDFTACFGGEEEVASPVGV